MDLTVPTVEGLLTLVGLAAVTTVAVEILLRALDPPEGDRRRYGPLVALIVGTVFTLLAAFFVGADYLNAFIAASLVGWTSMGMYDTLTKTVMGDE